MRRRTFTDHSVTYGAVGGSLAPDLLTYPPKGYRPREDSTKIGSGRARFLAASVELLTWGVQTGADIRVEEVSAGSGSQYAGLVLDDEGKPLAKQPEPAVEQRFGPDGQPYISPGMTAVLRTTVWRWAIEAPVLVVHLIEEENRTGFGYGTLPGHPESGEESFILEHRPDDSVWLVIRSFSKPSKSYRWFAPVVAYWQRRYTQRYLRALHPAAKAG